MYSCPENAVSPSASDAITSCKCAQGYMGTILNVNDLCEACPVGTFKTANGEGACVACSAGKYSVSEASTSSDSCISCAPFSTSETSSSSVRACFCIAGYEGTWIEGLDDNDDELTCTACSIGTFNNITNSTCQACASGTYADTQASLTCTSCPINSGHVDTGQTSIQACVCDAGFSGSQGVCEACPPGTYAMDTGECILCPVDTYSVSFASSSCTNCPSNSNSLEGSSLRQNCSCAAGYEWRNQECVACEAGFEKPLPGNEVGNVCSACAVGKYAGGGATVSCTPCGQDTFQNATGQSECIACREHSVSLEGSSDALQCKCLPGYYYCTQCQQCKACHIGFYKEHTANEACVSCGLGVSTAFGASTSSNNCTLCPAQNYIYSSPDGDRMCTSCPTNTVSLAGSEAQTSCTCKPGFTGSNDACEACAVGKYKPLAGSQACFLCPEGYIGSDINTSRVMVDSACVQCDVNMYSMGLEVCVQCPPYTSSPAGSNEIWDCACWPGYTQENGACVVCATGKYKSTAGSVACTDCPVNTYQPFTNATTQTSCLSCKDHSTSVVGSDDEQDCQCEPGYRLEDGNCVACVAGSYKSDYGPLPCSLCPTNTYYSGSAPYTSNQCTTCPDNTQDVAAGAGIESCLCSPGYIKENNACRPCLEGYYCPSQTQEIQCYHGATSLAGGDGVEDCVCMPGYQTNCTSDSEPTCYHSCLLCPVNSYCVGGESRAQACPGNASTLTHAGSTNISACVCNPGWYEAEGGVCVQCAADMYCANDVQASCPPNSTALAGTGSIAQCYCDEYFTRDAANQCHLCGAHLVCAGVETVVVNGVTTLQAGSVSVCAAGAVNVNQRCVCAEGFYCNDGTSNASCADLGVAQCNACLYGSFCSNNMLYSCGQNKTSSPKSSHIDHCACAEGYYLSNGADNTEQCLQCPVGSFCSNETMTSCTDFDTRLTTSTVGQSSQQACVCPLGHFRLYTNDTCKVCPQNYYCPSEHETRLPNAVACGENQFTLTTGSSHRSACKCLAGFVMSSDADTFMQCLPCPAGHRCVDGEVQEFFCHLQNRTANEDHSECVCLPGFEEDVDGFCKPCAEGYTKAGIGNQACTPCNQNNYYLNDTTCAACGVDESSSSDFLSCVCNAPYVGGGPGECVPCAVDHYYTYSFWYGGICLPCPLHSSTRGASNQSGLASCVCDAGYINTNEGTDNFVCESCPSGFYAEDNECKSCGENAITSEGSSSLSACFCNTSMCHEFVWGNTCSGECEVAPEVCNPCAQGHYKNIKSSVGNKETCLLCPADQYQPDTGQSVCTLCHTTRTIIHLGSSSPDDCVCRRGYEELNTSSSSSCSACIPGYFKADIGDFSCQPCAVGSFASDVGTEQCSLCSIETSIENANTTLLQASTHVDNCTCLSGYMLEDDPPRCAACQQGSYKSSPGEHACRLCGEDITQVMIHDLHDTIHHYGENDTAATSYAHCLQCPLYSGQDPFVVTYNDPMNAITDCLCFPAHDSFDAQTGCQHCSNRSEWGAYAFKIGYSNENCQLCAAGKYFVGHNVECNTCELNDVDNASRHHIGIVLNYLDNTLPWGTSFDDCDCDLGNYRLGDECHACAQGFYRNNSLNRECQPCGVNEYQDQQGQTQCKACPPNSYADTTQNTQITQCLCEAGFEWNDDSQECVSCSAGTSKGKGLGVCTSCPAGTYSLAQAPVCISCGANERSNAASGSPHACNCLPGYGSDDHSQCLLCGNGTFSGGGARSAQANAPQQRPACEACPANKNSTQGSIERANCKCIPGHGDKNNNADDSDACSPCENGFYASGGSNIACFSCGFGTITNPPQAAFAFSCCQCDAARGLYILDEYWMFE